MLSITPQERLALIVLALLLSAGAVTRQLAARAEAAEWLESTVASADTSTSNPARELRARVAGEVMLNRVRNSPLAPGERIDPNTAPPEQLDRLPRIGPALAERIVAHRMANEPFRDLQDLRAVSGIGPALLETISPHLALSARPSPGTRRPPAGNQVDLNRASAVELQALPGIGPVVAARIVEYREQHGAFRSFQDLEKVSGIGPRLRTRLEGLARLGS